METRTATTILSAPKTQVFEYLSRIENLPPLGHGVRPRAAVRGRQADGRQRPRRVLLRHRRRSRHRRDRHVRGPARKTSSAPSPRGSSPCRRASAYTFTMFQAPGMSDELFESQYAACTCASSRTPRARFA